jgi:HTH-type transcriptional regulator/antitoxin HigA
MTMKSTSKTSGASVSYLKLIRDFPLRPLRTAGEYEAAGGAMRALTSRKGRLDGGERDYLAGLAAFIAMYERQMLEKQLRAGTPLGRLKILMGRTGMRPQELEKVFNSSRALVSLVLHGRRELSKANIRALARHFKLSADYFL